MRVSVRLRLTLLYTAVTILAVVVIFGFTFLSLYRALQQDDLRDMQNRMLGYWALFQTGGIDALAEDVSRETFFMGDRLALIRVADRLNNTLLFTWPEPWGGFNPVRLEVLPLDPKTVYELHSPDHEYNLEVAGIWLSDDYHLQLGVTNHNRVRLMRGLERSFLVISLIVVALGFGVGLLVAQRSLRPVDRVTSLARQIMDTGRLDQRVEEGTGGGELEELVTVINGMLARIDALVAGLKNTVDMVAHDLRTPITRLRARGELALRSSDYESARHALEETVEQSDEILRMVTTLLDITEAESRVMRLRHEEVDLPRLLEEVRDLYELPAEEREISLVVRCPVGLVVHGDPVRLCQVVANLVDNAVKYCRRGGEVRVECQPGVRITVADTGIGLGEEELQRIWDRLYRGPVQPDVPGLGLGLSLVRAVVEAHGGTVAAESRRGEGTVLTVDLPAGSGGDTHSTPPAPPHPGQ